MRPQARPGRSTTPPLEALPEVEEGPELQLMPAAQPAMTDSASAAQDVPEEQEEEEQEVAAVRQATVDAAAGELDLEAQHFDPGASGGFGLSR